MRLITPTELDSPLTAVKCKESTLNTDEEGNMAAYGQFPESNQLPLLDITDFRTVNSDNHVILIPLPLFVIADHL